MVSMGTLLFILPLLCTVLAENKTGSLQRPFIVTTKSPVLGGDLTLNCVTPDPINPGDVEYGWIKDSIPLPVFTQNSLTLSNVSTADDGGYACRVTRVSTNDTSPESSPLFVRVLVLPELYIPHSPPKKTVVENSTLVLLCSTVNKPRPSVSYSQYGWTVTHGQRTTALNNSGFSLSIPMVNRSHSGFYSCHASNAGGSTNASVVVEVLYLDPAVKFLPSTWQTVSAGDNVTLTCQVVSLPTANLTWLHQGRVLQRVLRTVESNEDVYSFTAKGCQDSGEYQCRANNDAVKKYDLAGTKITVECGAPQLGEGSTSPARVTGKVGDNVTLNVTVTADPAPSFLWSGPGLSSAAAQSPSLALYSLQPQQAGLYTVTVSNKHGSLNHTFVLEITAKMIEDKQIQSETYTSEILTYAVGSALLLSVACLTVILIIYRKRSRRRKLLNSMFDGDEELSERTIGLLREGQGESGLVHEIFHLHQSPRTSWESGPGDSSAGQGPGCPLSDLFPPNTAPRSRSTLPMAVCRPLPPPPLPPKKRKPSGTASLESEISGSRYDSRPPAPLPPPPFPPPPLPPPPLPPRLERGGDGDGSGNGGKVGGGGSGGRNGGICGSGGGGRRGGGCGGDGSGRHGDARCDGGKKSGGCGSGSKSSGGGHGCSGGGGNSCGGSSKNSGGGYGGGGVQRRGGFSGSALDGDYVSACSCRSFGAVGCSSGCNGGCSGGYSGTSTASSRMGKIYSFNSASWRSSVYSLEAINARRSTHDEDYFGDDDDYASCLARQGVCKPPSTLPPQPWAPDTDVSKVPLRPPRNEVPPPPKRTSLLAKLRSVLGQVPATPAPTPSCGGFLRESHHVEVEWGICRRAPQDSSAKSPHCPGRKDLHNTQATSCQTKLERPDERPPSLPPKTRKTLPARQPGAGTKGHNGINSSASSFPGDHARTRARQAAQGPAPSCGILGKQERGPGRQGRPPAAGDRREGSRGEPPESSRKRGTAKAGRDGRELGTLGSLSRPGLLPASPARKTKKLH